LINKHQSKHYFRGTFLLTCYLDLTTFQVLSFCWQLDNNQSINIGVSFYYYPWLMPCGIKVEVALGIDFLQVVNTTSMQQQWIFLRIPFWKIITLTYILVFFFVILFISKHEFLKVYSYYIAYLFHYGFLYLRSLDQLEPWFSLANHLHYTFLAPSSRVGIW
jgi:hypothetical protein